MPRSPRGRLALLRPRRPGPAPEQRGTAAHPARLRLSVRTTDARTDRAAGARVTQRCCATNVVQSHRGPAMTTPRAHTGVFRDHRLATVHVAPRVSAVVVQCCVTDTGTTYRRGVTPIAGLRTPRRFGGAGKGTDRAVRRASGRRLGLLGASLRGRSQLRRPTGTDFAKADPQGSRGREDGRTRHAAFRG
jgi:hypothetical protein